MRGDDHIKELWRELHRELHGGGIEVTLASDAADRQAGVRDGFRRYFNQVVGQPMPIAIVPRHCEEVAGGLPAGDRATLDLAHRKAAALLAELGDSYHFYVATEGGLEMLTVAGKDLHFIRNWTVILGPFGEAWGCSGSLQLPPRLIASLDGATLDKAAVAMEIPGTRRSGGIISSLTHGAENRRSAVAQSTFNALCSLFYGCTEMQPRALR